MSDELYRVVLKGYQAGKGEYYVELDFAKQFKISPEKARELLSSAPTIIKNNITLEKANQYKKVMDKIGVTCEIESTKFNITDLSLE